MLTFIRKNEDRKITLSNRGYRKIVSICYPESKIICDIRHMFGVASVIHIGVISHHISVSVSLFRFGRVRIAVTIGNITKLVLGMILRSNNTLRFDKYFMFSSFLLTYLSYHKNLPFGKQGHVDHKKAFLTGSPNLFNVFSRGGVSLGPVGAIAPTIF